MNQRVTIRFTTGPSLPQGRNALTIEDIRVGLETLYGAEVLDLELNAEYADHPNTASLPRTGAGPRGRFGMPKIERWSDVWATLMWAALLFGTVTFGARYTQDRNAPGWVIAAFTVVDIVLIVGVIRTAARWWK